MALGIPGRLEGLGVVGRLKFTGDIGGLRGSKAKAFNPCNLTLYPYYLTLST